ncbi:RNA-guided endonuclease InsQ/TnpB family protein [Streptomyces sp. NPDC060232]|uniref:RNA-guided endonuclease InsQ/TnpB family protein n=1 Tax=Streptomyces sp. NPDC060232 TaxID=3347079 RepID=UPI0036584C7B
MRSRSAPSPRHPPRGRVGGRPSRRGRSVLSGCGVPRAPSTGGGPRGPGGRRGRGASAGGRRGEGDAEALAHPKNRAKARTRVARQHARVADRRRDWHHKESTKIIRDNQAVYVEDLAVSGLARTRLAKSVHDAGWSAFVGMLEYKAAKHGRYFGRIGRFEPTSQVCSACGIKDGPKPLNVREWTCQECGTVHDRDVNAARNILAAGRADRLNACGAPVRRASVPAQRREAGSHQKGQTAQAGIPVL